MTDSLVAVFIRHRGSLLWRTGVSGADVHEPITVSVEDSIDDIGAAAVDAVIGDVDVRIIRQTGPFEADDSAPDALSYATLADLEGPTQTAMAEHLEWAPPQDVETPAWWWPVYGRVAPSVRTIAADTTHGSSYLAMRAVEVLRDRAAHPDVGRDELVHLARELKSVRPDMVAIKVRLANAMADGPAPLAVCERAQVELEAAASSTPSAARVAVDTLGAVDHLACFSRSETALAAVSAVDPDVVTLTRADPGGEGVTVGESLATTHRVRLWPDTGIARALADGPAAVLVGADGIDADGSVVNKVGTHPLAATAATLDVPVYVVASVAKCCTGITAEERAPGSNVYDGEAPIEVVSPRFDRTPASLIAGYLTDGGRLDTDSVADYARRHAARIDAMP